MDPRLSRRHKPRLGSAEPQEIGRAYAECLALARSHYENFPVASKLLPKNVRPAVAVIYAFARRADDIADEGDLPAAERLAQLATFRAGIDALANHEPVSEPLFLALADVTSRYELPLQLFRDLLTAFEQDVVKKRYANAEEVLDYCAHSANPVGRLMLHLFNQATPRNLARSDAICTALQLINFLQDMAQDYHEMGRIYLPENLMDHFGVSERHFHDRVTDLPMQRAFAAAVTQARTLMLQGAPLAWDIPGRFGWELRAIVSGGLCVLDQLAALNDDVFSRPRREWRDWVKIAGMTLKKSAPEK